MEAGKKMHKELKELEWGACGNCQEYCFTTELEKYKDLCKLCHQNKAGRRAMLCPDNNLMPIQAPECLQRLTPVEKSAISLICPSISIYKKGLGSATKRHCISFFQDVPQMASILPPLPGNLSMIVLKKPTEANKDKSFRANRQHTDGKDDVARHLLQPGGTGSGTRTHCADPGTSPGTSTTLCPDCSYSGRSDCNIPGTIVFSKFKS
jgi:hypothetical protein